MVSHDVYGRYLISSTSAITGKDSLGLLTIISPEALGISCQYYINHDNGNQRYMYVCKWRYDMMWYDVVVDIIWYDVIWCDMVMWYDVDLIWLKKQVFWYQLLLWLVGLALKLLLNYNNKLFFHFILGVM